MVLPGGPSASRCCRRTSVVAGASRGKKLEQLLRVVQAVIFVPGDQNWTLERLATETVLVLVRPNLAIERVLLRLDEAALDELFMAIGLLRVLEAFD